MLNEGKISQIKRGLKSQRVSQLPQLFNALGEKNRFLIFKLLMSHNVLCPTDLAKILNLSIPAISHQCKNLLLTQVVVKERMGRMNCFSLNRANPVVRALIKFLSGHETA